MTNHNKTKLSRLALIACFLLTLGFGMQSCKKSRSEMGKDLYSKTKNKVYKDVTPEGFEPVFKAMLESEGAKLPNAKIILAHYAANGYDPTLLLDHLSGDDIKALPQYLNKSNEHGLDPTLFRAAKIDTLINNIYGKKSIKTLEEAYHDMAELEMTMAASLISYSNALQFGVFNPRKIYQRYYTATARPDSAYMNNALNTKDFKSYLDSIQPKDKHYVALQKALMEGFVATGQTKEETQRTLVTNLERLRWKNKPTQDRYVIVNIADFRLDVMNQGKSELNMKVCVGEGRNKDAENSLVEYDESDKVDRPFSRETPQLASEINMVQVNPIWNIPVSIASKEIVVEAQKDPYYLANKNINVYKDGKLIDDPETIEWNANSGTEYSFKQQPGSDNSLGKIKFLFPNKSSVYLHDTPAQAPFGREMRAVSHGCVRLEKPLEFARVLFGDGTEKFQKIEQFMGEDKSQPTDLALPKKVPVYLTYVTGWVDDAGQIQIRPDVYGLDIVLYGHLQKLIRG
ncbi:L,D-transpeptidase scaffold domain-containing protein [Mucilaginibacter myungsuensis]|uniref:L,D-transpeptidase family protein n=1 Tax=Mucilaginibacter myungsuensis TaxID=649104 RepID=A0A929KTZ4_9SPHI|nr:L,D-transpeptidase family protein [Mucilaginibacter myungsuensis]MBE9660373.1 L,D-transpeptidase family protein [Mucilaginibacter myungsuensis]MDN3600415.1 L,D-transpeptidase family protein [Mucilaginibacter myungsuensis]